MNIPETWWVDFFNGPFGELQVEDARSEATARDVERIVSVIGPARQRILDAPCGIGRHSVELARRGYDVLGIDFNPRVLDAAQTTAQSHGLDAAFQQHDLRQLSFEAEFDAALCLWTSIGYFSDLENEKALMNLAKALKPGGHLILDAVVLESLCPMFSARGPAISAPRKRFDDRSK
jgi:2-polyprenyl-3-methyl-5-hydroxy-6-metoxy-1,4-benzoquinol methylase